MDDMERARRRFLKEGLALAGLAYGATRSAYGQTGDSVACETQPEKNLDLYGERSHFVTSVRLADGMDSHHDPFGLTHHIKTPLPDLLGIITPSSLHYVASHVGVYIPDIDPKQHRLMIHGMVDRPLLFTMDELKRLPFISRIQYLECNGNKPKPSDKTLQEAQGRTSCSEWTGVPVSLLLKEAGMQNGASWIVAEGADDNKGAFSIPLAKAMDDCLVAYGQNGEPVRPQNGFPLRLLVPGFEGTSQVKWLRRIKVTDEFYTTYNNKERYTSADPKLVKLNYEQGPKSVICFPSGGQRLPGPGHYEISGLAWSGSGIIRRVEVSTDGGQTWKDAEIRGAVHRIAHTRFGMSWDWHGEEHMFMSRCTDELGQVQPTLAEFARFYKLTGKALFSVGPLHHNWILPWKVDRDGSVTNGLA